MNVTERASGTLNALIAVLGATPSEEQRERALRMLEQALVNAMLEQAERCSNEVMECCSPDLDIAHKVEERFRRANHALIANLSSMR